MRKTCATYREARCDAGLGHPITGFCTTFPQKLWISKSDQDACGLRQSYWMARRAPTYTHGAVTRSGFSARFHLTGPPSLTPFLQCRPRYLACPNNCLAPHHNPAREETRADVRLPRLLL